MSALAGVYLLDGRPVSREVLDRMVETVAHRGPDGSHVWVNGSIALAHLMLFTTPESLCECLPLVTGAGFLAITADARIDNRDELLARLHLDGRAQAELSDSELILTAYRKWGEHCPEYLEGDFAFAIWDAREERLFCARDHFGVKPFYYHASRELFAFGSEIKTLLAVPGVPRRLNEVCVADYLEMQVDDLATTMYEGVFRLPPAHSITVTPEGCRFRSYHSFDPSRELRLRSDEEYAEAFRELFTRAVGCCLRSAYPVGSLLSGGLDSSSITCVARDLQVQSGKSPLPTISLGFDKVSRCDERQYVRMVIAQGNLEPTYVAGDAIGPLNDLECVYRHLDEPILAGNLFLGWALNRAAGDRGLRVLLDGFDGDTTVSHGVGYLHELAHSRRWIRLMQEAGSRARKFNESPLRVQWSWARQYAIAPLAARFPEPVRRGARTLRRHLAHESSDSHVPPGTMTPLNSEFAHRIGLEQRREAIRRHAPGHPRTEREDHYRKLTQGALSLFLGAADRQAAPFGLEKRYPFCDKRLAEFCLALPPEQKLRQGWSRLILRRAMRDILPEGVRWRGGKTDLRPNFEHGLTTIDRHYLVDVMETSPALIEPYVDLNALRPSYLRLLAGTASVNDSCAVWITVSLALWLRHTGLTA